MNSKDLPQDGPAIPAPNRYDRMEWAGAFGDLGTLVPFLLAYISLVKVDPFGVLFAFGVAKIVAGLYYRTPFPVQPMKAVGVIATTQAVQSVVIAPAAVVAASLATGLFWLLLGLTGASRRVVKLITRPVAVGIILGLGFGFMLDGMRMMASDWLLGGVGLAGTVLLLSSRRVPAMLLLLLFGVAVAAWQDPRLLQELAAIRPEFRLPGFALAELRWSDVAIGVLFLALPQLPLTLGNAIVAVTHENNREFPHRPVTERKVSISTGLMNLFGATVGGVPMCHGAGGMAGHVRFGARTGGALVILGTFILFIALFFSGSVTTIFKVFPQAVLGVTLFLAGVQLALGAAEFGKDRSEHFVVLATAGFAAWNVGLAFVAGLGLHYAIRRGWLRT